MNRHFQTFVYEHLNPGRNPRIGQQSQFKLTVVLTAALFSLSSTLSLASVSGANFNNSSSLSQAQAANKTLVAAKSQADAPPAAPVDSKKPYSAAAVEHYNRAIDLHQSAFLKQAIAEYQAAIAADPRMEEAYSNLGVIYAAQHNYPKAKEAFTQALALKPNRPTTLNGLGTVLYAQKKFDEAKDKWMQAVTVDPNFSSAYYNMGNALETENKLEEAKKIFVRAISVTPNMADAYYRLAVIMHKQHHDPQSSALLRKAIAIAPEGEFIRDAKRLLQGIDAEAKKADTEALEKLAPKAANKLSRGPLLLGRRNVSAKSKITDATSQASTAGNQVEQTLDNASAN